MGEPNATEAAVRLVESDISRVEGEITRVEQQIAQASAKIDELGGPGEGTAVRSWMRKEEQLRGEKEQLRRKEEQLRREKEQLRERLLLYGAHASSDMWGQDTKIAITAHNLG